MKPTVSRSHAEVVPERGARPRCKRGAVEAHHEVAAVSAGDKLGSAAWFGLLFVAAVLINRLELETAAFRNVMFVGCAAAFTLHFVPMRLRMAGFTALSLGVMVWLLGYTEGGWRCVDGLSKGAVVLGIGLVLISICRWRIGFWPRAGLLMMVGSVVGTAAGFSVGGSSWNGVWVLVASIFMFRIMVYLYDVSTSKQLPRISETAAYFALLPNMCVPLFPVVDFRTFAKSRSARSTWMLYERGVRWIVRGVIHLVLYRFVDRVISLRPEDVLTGAQVTQFVVASMLFYLRVSGVFHIVIGLLVMCGFDLPETNRRYFLASSFTDYWRRVNMYWKDFILKVFYLPTYFRFKHCGPTRALVFATLFAFLMTWILHAYQTWWLRGFLSFSWPDTLFWTVLGLLVVGNGVWELKRKPTATNRQVSVGGTVRVLLATALTAAVIAVLWSLWNTTTLSLWLTMWSHADLSTVMWFGGMLAVIMVSKFVVEVLPTASAKTIRERKSPKMRKAVYLYAMHLFVLIGIMIVSFPTTHERIPAYVRPILGCMTSASITGNIQGYYDQLLDGPQGDTTSYDYGQQDRIHKVLRPVTDLRQREMIPGLDFVRHGVRFVSNASGMHDREVPVAKPPGTIRIAVLGSSHVMGWGVTHDQVLSRLLERKLNNTASLVNRCEVLNFAVSGYSPLNQLGLIEHSVRRYSPDIVLFVSHSVDQEWTVMHTQRVRAEDTKCPYSYIEQTLLECDIAKTSNEILARCRLLPRGREITAWAYQQIVVECQTIGALPVAAFAPLPREGELLRRLASNRGVKDALQLEDLMASGFVVMDLRTVFDGRQSGELALRRWEGHYSHLAHQLVAEVLFDQMMNNTTVQEVLQRPVATN